MITGASPSLSFSRSFRISPPQIDVHLTPLISPISSPRRPLTVSAAYASTAEKDARYHTPKQGTAMTVSQSLYEVLGIESGSTSPEIKAAYRKLARSCHPDVVAIDRKDASAGQFMLINAAYATLSDPNKRAEYDRDLVVSSNRRGFYRSASFSSVDYSGPSSSVSGFGRRTWETDQCW